MSGRVVSARVFVAVLAGTSLLFGSVAWLISYLTVWWAGLVLVAVYIVAEARAPDKWTLSAYLRGVNLPDAFLKQEMSFWSLKLPLPGWLIAIAPALALRLSLLMTSLLLGAAILMLGVGTLILAVIAVILLTWPIWLVVGIIWLVRELTRP
jgi:hypothetical protein